MINQDALALLIRGEAIKTRGLVEELIGVVLMVVAILVAISNYASTEDVIFAFTTTAFWLAVLIVGPLGTVLLFFGWNNVTDGKKAVSRANEVLSQTKFQ